MAWQYSGILHDTKHFVYCCIGKPQAVHYFNEICTKLCMWEIAENVRKV